MNRRIDARFVPSRTTGRAGAVAFSSFVLASSWGLAQEDAGVDPFDPSWSRPATVQSANVPRDTASGPATVESESADPSEQEVPLPTVSPDWNASLVVDNGDVGIWTVKAFEFLPQYACPEVVGVDDQGRCLIMIPYSGKWTTRYWIHDGKWLGGLTHGDVDPRVDGSEIYTGGQLGNLYQLTGSAHGALDARRIGWIPGHEVHTIVVDPFTDSGDALLVFTRPGGLFRLRADGEHGGFTLTKISEPTGRTRDAVVIEGFADDRPVIATVGRPGKLELLEERDGELRWSTVYEATTGMGRIGRGGQRGAFGAEGGLVLYTSLDDGRVVRHERVGESWHSEDIYYGPQGPRGVVAGRFHEDPSCETVAVFGYGAKVELLSRRPGDPWQVETLFVDRDRGHWLSAAELDSRNGTDELLASGYGGRVVLLSRPPGYGKPDSVPRVER